jgi:monomeric isocitrate dehydrogenase
MMNEMGGSAMMLTILPLLVVGGELFDEVDGNNHSQQNEQGPGT